jgi:hypothetical protein
MTIRSPDLSIGLKILSEKLGTGNLSEDSELLPDGESNAICPRP